MAKLTQEQVEVIRDYLRENPKQSPVEVGWYFGRVADIDEDTTDRVTTVAMMIMDGDDSAEQLAPFLENA